MRLISGSAFVAGLAMSLGVYAPAAVAGPGSQQIYIVQTRGEPAASYEGGEAGFVRTRPERGQRLDATSTAVRNYLRHLTASHDRIISSAGVRKVYDYGITLNGFAAEMTESQALQLQARDDVVAVYPSRNYDLDTNITPGYLGLSGRGGTWRARATGEDVVVGVLDGGIWPEHPCFADVPTRRRGDRGRKIPYGPPPASFTGAGAGACQFGNTAFNPGDAPFTCNNKLLSARFYVDGFGGASGITADECLSARDCGQFGDHGTNVAGNVACNAETEAFLNGESEGEIFGMAPRARIAHYKVCWTTPTAPNGTCSNVDLVAAIDQAIADGVDVMNLSLGSDSPILGDAFDLALLNATAAGIFVATSAGNAGPGPGTVGSPATAPWVTSVGAIQDFGVTATGLDVQTPAALAGIKIGVEGAGPVTLEDSGDIVSDIVLADPIVACGTTAGPLTNAAALNGKIALVRRGTCSFDEKYLTVQAAGARAIVVFNDGADPFRIDPFTMGGISSGVTIPGIMIGNVEGSEIAASITAGVGVTGRLSPTIEEKRFDRMATFSSRGPNGFTPDVLKPDIVAPGVDILSAGSPLGGIFDGGLFSVISGTSFSSPHMAGLFALMKEAHPTWSPAAARSAFMTSANENIRETFRDDYATPFDVGGGLAQATAAIDTGLVYETDLLDYAGYSCGQGIFFDSATCGLLQASGITFDPAQMNYPSIAASAVVGQKVITRTVTNVSGRTQRWRSAMLAPPGFDAVVSPSTIRLRDGESATFTVTLTVRPDAVLGEWSFGQLFWKTPGNGRGRGDVVSPIAARAQAFAAPANLAVSGTSGSETFDVQFGYTGAYTSLVHGLDPAARTASTVADDPGDDFIAALGTPGVVIIPVTVPAFGTGGPAFARFSLSNADTDGDDDLDLYVIDPGFTAIVGQSANADSNETVDLVFPAAGTYNVAVHGFSTDGPDSNFTLSSWSFGLVDDRGNSSVSGPASATSGTTSTLNYSWSGLTAGTKYLGAVSHSDANGLIGLTLVEAN